MIDENHMQNGENSNEWYGVFCVQKSPSSTQLSSHQRLGGRIHLVKEVCIKISVVTDAIINLEHNVMRPSEIESTLKLRNY